MGKPGAELKKQILQQVIGLAEAFGLPISEARQNIYVEALSDIPIETLKNAVGFIIKTRIFAGNLPTVAEIREAVSGQGESLDTRIALAWDKLMFAIERHGYYDSVQFDDPVISLILKSWGGWMKFSGEVREDELKWVRKDFEKLYRAYAPTSARINGHLIGAFEHENGGLVWEDRDGRRVELYIYRIGGKVGDLQAIPFKPEERLQIEAKTNP